MKKQQAHSFQAYIRRDIRRVLVFGILCALLVTAGATMVDGRTGFLITGEARTTLPQVEENVVKGSLFGMDYAIPLPQGDAKRAAVNAVISLIPPSFRAAASGVSLSIAAAPETAQWLHSAADAIMEEYR